VVDGEVADFERGRVRVARVPGGERHLQHGRGGQHRPAQEAVVGQPRLQGGVEQPGPAVRLSAVAEAEQRVFGDRVRQAPRLGGGGVPHALAVEGRRRQAAPRRRAGEGGTAARVGARREGAVGDGGERVARRALVAPVERGQHGGGLSAAAQRVAQVALEHGVRADLHEQRRPGRGGAAHGGEEGHRLAQVAPPVERRAVRGPNSSPVTVDTSGTRGGAARRPSSSAKSPSRTGAMAALWKA
jgi:hypothetical protein